MAGQLMQSGWVAAATVAGALACSPITRIARRLTGSLGTPTVRRWVPFACVVVSASVALAYGPTLEAVELLLFAAILMVVTLTDLDAFLIPHGCVAAAVAVRVGYVACAVWVDRSAVRLISFSLVGAAALTVPLALLVLIMDHVLGRPSMGGGDIKLLAVSGLYFGWRRGIMLVFVACVIGLGMAAFGPRVEAGQRRDVFPFGPAIACACWLSMLAGGR